MGSDNKNIEEYQSVLDTVRFLTAEGEYELALRISQCTLEKIYLEKEVTTEQSFKDDEKVDAIRRHLTEKYLNARSLMEKGARPYWQAFIKTLIVSGVISLTCIITFAVLGNRFRIIKTGAGAVASTAAEQLKVEKPVEKVASTAAEQLKVEKPVEKVASPAAGQLRGMFVEKVGDTEVRTDNHLEKHGPSKFIDGDVSTFWHSAEPPGNFGWVSVSYEKPFKASKYTITRRADISSQAPVEFILEGTSAQNLSTGSVKWEVIDERKNQTWEKTVKSYSIKQPKPFMHYRLRIIKTGDDTFASVAEWHLYK